LVANAGLSAVDTRSASADGYELTFAVNYLAHAQLIDGLLDSFTTPARIVLVGSSTYYANWVRRLMMVPAAEWTDPLEIAKPAGSDVSPTQKAAGVAYSNSKLAILYYAHELQRRAPEGINVAVFEPGFMPGTGLSRQHGPGVQRMGRGMQRLPLPGIASPVKSGPRAGRFPGGGAGSRRLVIGGAGSFTGPDRTARGSRPGLRGAAGHRRVRHHDPFRDARF
jgi:NAD(P)-dependent dehydrogenase (short-subunit alcohol dehydrogenase family)